MCVHLIKRGVRAQVISYSGVEAVQNLSIKSSSEWKALTLNHSPFPAVSTDSLKQKREKKGKESEAPGDILLNRWSCPAEGSAVNNCSPLNKLVSWTTCINTGRLINILFCARSHQECKKVGIVLPLSHVKPACYMNMKYEKRRSFCTWTLIPLHFTQYFGVFQLMCLISQASAKLCWFSLSAFIRSAPSSSSRQLFSDTKL